MEMQKLVALLKEAHIPYEIMENRHNSKSIEICYPVGPVNHSDCICGVMSLDSNSEEEGMLEILGLIDGKQVKNGIENYLTADEVFTRIKKHYMTYKKNIYTYDRAARCYTEECNLNIDYIIHHLPGIEFTASHGSLVQLRANQRTTEILDFLRDCDLMCGWKEKTIEEVEDMMK